jgi:hypothetical protein
MSLTACARVRAPRLAAWCAAADAPVVPSLWTARRWQSQDAAAAAPAAAAAVLPAASPPPPPAAVLPASPFLAVPPGLAVARLPNKGRALVATAPFAAGSVLFQEAPLVAVGDPLATDLACAHCFLPVPLSGSARRTTCACGYVYCSPACKEAHAAGGHDVLCGSARELDAFCAAHRVNFPRVAAAALGKSLGGTVDFMDFWGAVQALVSLPVAADADGLPPLTHEGYAAVKAAVSARMDGDAEGFWRVAFDVRTYARLLGTLRLNSFSVSLHNSVDGGGRETSPLLASAGVGGSGQAGAAGGAPAAAAATGAAAAEPPPAAASACGSHSHDSAAGGGSCSDASPDGGCCSGDGTFTERSGGGTAVYGVASMMNHACDPSAEALLHARGTLRVVATRDLAPGDEVTISYLGEAGAGLPVGDRRGRLAAGYGFECRCARCVAEAAAAVPAKARASARASA